jgi:hypothetical protein
MLSMWSMVNGLNGLRVAVLRLVRDLLMCGMGEGEQYGRVAGIGQGVVLLPVVDAIGANLIC